MPFADQGWEIALVTLAIVIGVQFFEGNFLQPIIQSRTVDLHPAVILLAAAAGGSLFGLLGAYLAVPVTAVVTQLVRRSPPSARSQAGDTADQGGAIRGVNRVARRPAACALACARERFEPPTVSLEGRCSVL